MAVSMVYERGFWTPTSDSQSTLLYVLRVMRVHSGASVMLADDGRFDDFFLKVT